MFDSSIVSDHCLLTAYLREDDFVQVARIAPRSSRTVVEVTSLRSQDKVEHSLQVVRRIETDPQDSLLLAGQYQVYVRLQMTSELIFDPAELGTPLITRCR
jgi:hypothetical protein